jgi:hypothetical protein
MIDPPILLKCENVRTLPYSIEGRGTTLHDEYLILKKLYGLAHAMKQDSLVVKPLHFFQNMFEIPSFSCYSMNILGELKNSPLINREYDSKLKWDTVPFWSHVFDLAQNDSKESKMEKYREQFEDLISELGKKVVHEVPSGSLSFQKWEKFKKLLDLFHKRGYVHGDLPGNIVQWKDHVSIIDPMGFRPFHHYARECDKKKSKERTLCVQKDPFFKQFEEVDNKEMEDLLKRISPSIK